MTHSSFVQSHAAKLGDVLKVAADLAMLLDHEILSAATIAGQKFGTDRLALVRLEVLDDLGVLCFKQGVPVPELEPEILELCRPKSTDEKHSELIHGLVRDARRSVGGRKPKSDAKRDLLVMAHCLELMPGLARSDAELLCFKAMFNALLLQLGLPTLRVDFAARKVTNALDRMAPRPLRVVIVDDDVNEIVRTVRNLAGWPCLQFDPLHFRPNCDRWNCPSEKVAEIVRAAAQTIVDRRPDIVVMDEGLPISNGGEIIKAVKALKPESKMQFVGSTGGSGDQLKAAGALLNLEKGGNPGILEQAIWRLS